jgi:hypothetical protein
MRQAVEGEELSLPAWEDWGRLAGDGLRTMLVGLAYLGPGMLVFWAGMGLYPFPNTIIPLWNMTQTWSSNPYAIALFDDQRTPGRELMPQIMKKSLYDALDWITGQLGPPADAAFSNWKYGNLHVVDFGHAMGSQLSFLNVPASGPVGCDGGPYTVDPGGHYHKLIVKEVLYVETGSSYRGIYECKDGWDTSLILVPPGESGQVTGNPVDFKFSPHYGDTFLMWLNNEYTPCLFNDAVIETFPSMTFKPSITGDLNLDGTVNILDLGILAEAFLSYPNHPRWNPTADIDKNKVVNIIDAVLIGKHFGQNAA